MKLVVGLGNPGDQYKFTRHNVGFLAIDQMIEKFNLGEPKNFFNALIWEHRFGQEKVVFLKPQTYMNLSGESVREIVNYFKLPLEEIVIIYDDKDIGFNSIKMKKSGSDGGQRGMRDIIEKLHTNDIKRIKIGIGNNKNYSTKNWVLSKFSNEELEKLLKGSLAKVCEIVEKWITKQATFEKLMSLYNGIS